MAHDVFLSHSVKDKAVADAIVARLETDSVTCWIAPRDVVPGADWGESIIDAIETSRSMILVFSKSANASPQIEREVERAVNKEVYIIPFRIDDIAPSKSLEYFISTPQWMDAFPPPLERYLDNLAKTVKTVLASRSRSKPVDIEAAVGKPSEGEQLVATLEVKNIGTDDVDIEPYCEFFLTEPPLPGVIVNYPTGRVRLTPLSDQQSPFRLQGSESKRYPCRLAHDSRI